MIELSPKGWFPSPPKLGINPSSPNSDKQLISPYSITTLMKHTGHENKENDHQLLNVFIFNQILPTSNIRNIRRIIRRIWMLILGLSSSEWGLKG